MQSPRLTKSLTRYASGRVPGRAPLGGARRWRCCSRPSAMAVPARPRLGRARAVVPAAARRVGPARRLGHGAGGRARRLLAWGTPSTWRPGCRGGGCCWRRTPPGWPGCSRSPWSTGRTASATCSTTRTSTSTPRGPPTTCPRPSTSYISRIPVDAPPDNWPVHVAGHPPGALTFFVLLVRLGLGERAGGRAGGHAPGGVDRGRRARDPAGARRRAARAGWPRRSWSSGRPRSGSACRRTRCSRPWAAWGMCALALAAVRRHAHARLVARSPGCCSAGA